MLDFAVARSSHPTNRSGVLLAALSAFLLSLSSLSAQVDYVRDLTFPSGVPVGSVLPLTKAPINTSDPLYNPALPDTQYIVMSGAGSESYHYRFDPVTGVVSGQTGFPPTTNVNVNTPFAMSGVMTSEPIWKLFYAFRRRLFIYDISSSSTVPPALGTFVPVGILYSLAAPDRSGLTAVADNRFYSINSNTGAVIELVAFGGEDPDNFSLDTYYHAYGSNGLVYLLDYGNDRMQMLDPANSFAFVAEFALETGVTTANMQFAIGTTGNIYLGDGLGGGSYYSSTGGYLGAFSLDTPVDPTLDIGTPYLSTDASGGVYVFDNTGFHQYRDVSVIPEPGSGAFLLLGAALLGRVFIRHRSRTHPV